jgi:hypothetical protein
MQTVRTPAVAGSVLSGQCRRIAHSGAAISQPDRITGRAAAQGDHRAPRRLYLFRANCRFGLRPAEGGAQSMINRVVLLGPSHRVGFRGIAVSGMTAFATPLGQVPSIRKRSNWREHCRRSVSGAGPRPGTQPGGAFAVPAGGAGRVQAGAAGGGRCPAAEVGVVLEALWGGPETLIVISSDLSHYQRLSDRSALWIAPPLRPLKRCALRTSAMSKPAGAIR